MVGGVFISPLSAGLWGFFFCIYGTFARRQVLQKLEMHDRGGVQVVEDVCSLSVCSRDRDEEQEGDVFVSLVFCWSNTVVLYDAEMLFEVHRFCPKQGVELCCAAAVSLPASLLMCSRHEDGLALAEESEDARATLPTGICSSSLPTGEVLLVVDLSSYSRSLHFSSVVLAAPASSSAAYCPNAVVAFVALNDEAGGNEETVLLAARSCADDHPLDQSVNFDELAMGNLNECGEERATASLRRQMELFIEHAANVKLELHASSFLVLTLQLVSRIPGFVVGSVVNLHETRSALKGDPTLAWHELVGNVRCRQGGYAVDGPVPRYLGN